MIARRSVLKGLGMLFVAPAIVRAESLMPIKEYMPAVPAWCPDGWLPLDGREIKKKFYPDLYAAYQKLRFPMQVANDQNYHTYSEYEVHINETRFSLLRGERRLVSYKDLIRPNGQLMRAGAMHSIFIPTEAEAAYG
jgi:Phage Tail Collar Domain